MIDVKSINSGTLKVKDLDKVKIFPKEYGINRNIDRRNVDRLKKSMKDCYIPSVIKVNQDWFIIDGQHTRQALMELAEEHEEFNDKEVIYQMYYTKSKEEARKVCILLNTTSKNWKYDDFMETWADSGNENYIWFKEFKEKYNFNLMCALYVVTGKDKGGIKRSQDNEFTNGELVVTQEQRIRATRIARQLQDVKKLVPKDIAKNRYFQNGFIKVALNEKYDHERMTSKLSYQYDRIHKCSGKNAYVEMLQDIYNYKSRDKINLVEIR